MVTRSMLRGSTAWRASTGIDAAAKRITMLIAAERGALSLGCLSRRGIQRPAKRITIMARKNVTPQTLKGTAPSTSSAAKGLTEGPTHLSKEPC